MKITDTCIEEFPVGFIGENTFICGIGVILQSIADLLFGELDAENNTILVIYVGFYMDGIKKM